MINGKLQLWKCLVIFFCLVPVGWGCRWEKKKVLLVIVINNTLDTTSAVKMYSEILAFIEVIIKFNMGTNI